MYSTRFHGLVLKFFVSQRRARRWWVNNTKMSTNISLVGQTSDRMYPSLMRWTWIVNNVPGLGVRGYAAHSQDIAINDKDGGARGNIPYSAPNYLPPIIQSAYRSKDGNFVLENSNLKATINADGQLIQLVDKHSERYTLS